MNAPRQGPALLWLGPPAAFAYSDDREKAVMQTAVHSYLRRSQDVRFYLAYGATYPLFLAAESLQRWLAGASVEGASQANRGAFGFRVGAREHIHSDFVRPDGAHDFAEIRPAKPDGTPVVT